MVWVVTTGSNDVCYWHLWVEARDATPNTHTHNVLLSMDPTTKNCLAQNVNSASAKKPDLDENILPCNTNKIFQNPLSLFIMKVVYIHWST